MSSKNLNELENDVKEFILECTELLDQAETDLLSLDSGSGVAFEKAYSSIFRVFHSLKGGAGMFGLEDMAKHMHHLENDLTICGAKKSASQHEISYFLKGVDAAKKILSSQSTPFNYDEFSQKTAAPRLTTVKIVEQNLQELVGKAIIIDDESEITEILKDILQSSHIEVFTFTDPILALLELKKIKPDIVLTDMKMPQMTGLDVLKRVKEVDSDIPVIFISGHLDKKTLINSISLGLYAALEKPFKEAEVISTATAAIKLSKMFKMLGRSIHLMLYQFADLEDFMKQKGQAHQAKLIKSELESLINCRKSIRDYKKAS
jgi:FixJ family two-component response regulator/HPt (histidine-containing phosphotransfer) domain-containing protein